MSSRNRKLKANKDHIEVSESYNDLMLPSSDELQKLKEIDPELVDFLKTYTSKEQDHRHLMNNDGSTLAKREQGLIYGYRYLALVLGFIFLIGTLYFTFELIMDDKTVEGALFGGAVLCYVAYLFISASKNTNDISPPTP